MNIRDWEIRVNELLPRLRRYARALTQDAHNADDLVQDCLERAWLYRTSWREGSNLRAWLFTIMHNLFINDVRRARRAQDHVNTVESLAISSGAPHHDTLRDVERCMSLLKPEYREAIILAGLEELSYKEIAEITGVALGTVMSRLSRGREILRQLMSDDNEPKLVRIK